MKFVSLFAGIGGFDLGLERAGMQCVGQVEIDKKCQLVLAKHWPNVKRISDIRDVKGDEFGTVDLICGGFPCQPFSTAGKRKGQTDDRYLWPEMLRVIQAIRPAWVIGENVAGIISLALDQVHSDLESIGYQVQSFIIPACAVGAPHRRDRVWVVANSRLLRPKNRKEQTTRAVECGQTTLPHTYNTGLQGGKRGGAFYEQGTPTLGSTTEFCQDVCNSTIPRLPDWCGGSVGQPFPLTEFERSGSDGKIREVERDFRGVPHGVSGRVDRLKQLGNAVVPQIPEIIGRVISQIEEAAAEECANSIQQAKAEINKH